jgi:hypothetical protein
MNNEVYEMLMKRSERLGKLLGTVGATLKYCSSGISDFDFKMLAKTYIEVSVDQSDIDRVKEVAKQRGINLDS